MLCSHYTRILSKVGEHAEPVGHCLGMKNMPTVKCDGCLSHCENEHMIEKIKDCTIYDVKIKRSDLTITEKTIAVLDGELTFEFADLIDELQSNDAIEINIKKRW